MLYKTFKCNIVIRFCTFHLSYYTFISSLQIDSKLPTKMPSFCFASLNWSYLSFFLCHRITKHVNCFYFRLWPHTVLRLYLGPVDDPLGYLDTVLSLYSIEITNSIDFFAMDSLHWIYMTTHRIYLSDLTFIFDFIGHLKYKNKIHLFSQICL